MNDVGKAYNHHAYPHLGAPGGPMDAFDCPTVRTISLEMGSRLGKSFFGQCAAIFNAENDPAPAMHANSTEKLCFQVLDRTYKMIRQRANLRALLKKKHEKDQRQDQIEFSGNILYGAWARSVSTLADKNIKFGHAGEVDKWEHSSTSKEADPLELFLDRFKDYQSVCKIVIESTPTNKGKSRIESLEKAGSSCRLHVPCPACKRYQQLLWSQLHYESLDGSPNPALAFSTAHYLCAHCRSTWHDNDRQWAVRRGVWCPAGCRVKDAEALIAAERQLNSSVIRESGASLGEDIAPWRGWAASAWVTGTPLRDGPDASYQLSSLYALSLTWGDIAKKWVQSHRNPQKLRNFINQWLGETWEPKKSKSSAEQVAERITGEVPRGKVPASATFLVVAIDRQAADGGFVKWGVIAHGPENRAWLIDYGQAISPQEINESVIRGQFPRQDGGPPMTPMLTVIDSGFNTKDTYEFAGQGRRIIPCKGSSTDLGGLPYKLSEVDRSNTGLTGVVLFTVNTDFWETDLEARLHERAANEPNSLTLFAHAGRDAELLDELLNGELTDATDSRGNTKFQWVKKDEYSPNDFRDICRYGLAAGQMFIDKEGGPRRHSPAAADASTKPPAPPEPSGKSGFSRKPALQADGGWVRRPKS